MNIINNDLFLRALRGQVTERTPVWIMRQAGRYLPEYRATRQRAGSFMQLCKNPDYACEVTLQPLARFPLDAAIIFSDILTIPDAMGLGLNFIPGKGPVFDRPVRSAADIRALPVPDPETELAYVPAAIRVVRQELAGRVPLLGFSGSPWTLATYMIEGQSSRDFALAKSLLFNEPQTMHALLSKMTAAVIKYLAAQIAAGAQAVMLFDTWGGILSHREYPEFSLQYIQQIIAELKHAVPVIVFTKGGGQWLAMLKNSGADALGLDWTASLAQARRVIGENITLQGNLDPAVLRADPAVIEAEVRKTLADYGYGQRHIFNLGHGITPDISPEHVSVLLEAVRKYSPAYHQSSPADK